jgi:nicotinate-nucleotide pyrophosphorylase (carboxylating)
MKKTPDFAELIRQALLEDRFDEDVTTGPLSPWDRPAQAVLKAKAEGVLSGLDLFAAVFTRVDDAAQVECLVADADRVRPGDLVARITGQQSALLGAERVALNFLQHLSGVATLTRRFVDLLAGSGVTVLDTRKTTPLLRDLEKRAVRHGGGRNHRRDLASMALIKENHIEMAGSITAAVTAIRARHPQVDVEVEVKNIEELREALSLNPQVIMLDNFTPETTREAVALKRPGMAYEISGNVSLENIRERVPAGIDFVSIGALTHSAPALDLSLLMTRK